MKENGLGIVLWNSNMGGDLDCSGVICFSDCILDVNFVMSLQYPLHSPEITNQDEMMKLDCSWIAKFLNSLSGILGFSVSKSEDFKACLDHASSPKYALLF